MNIRVTSLALTSLVASSLLSLSAFATEPQLPPDAVAPPPTPAVEPAAPKPDRARFRGGIGLEAGAVIVPGSYTVGAIGLQAPLGVQINNLIGVYALPNFDVIFGEAGGVQLGAAFIVDFTFDDQITVGVGPDLSLLAAFGGDSGSLSGVGGALYGARLRFGWSPALSQDPVSARRKALTIGADLRLLGGAAGKATVNADGSGSASASTFALSPMATISYSAF